MRKKSLIAKWVAVLLALCILCSLSACDSGKKASNPATKPTGSTEPDSGEPTVEDPTEESTTEETRGLESTVDTTQSGPGSDSEYAYKITPIAGAVPESERADASYFDDVVFIGDSVSLKLYYYEAAMDVLGGAQFLTAGSLGSGNALWNVSSESVHPYYNGQKRRIEESVAACGAKKVYIMLGMNDIAYYGIDGAVSNLITLIGLIKANAPDVQIYIQSMTPMTETSDLLSWSGHCPERIHTYNQKLAATCLLNEWYFIDVASVMYDGNGFLRREYCSDADGMGIHFTNAGCAAWVDYLYTHTAG